MPRILVVDDDPSIRALVAEFLEALGYAVDTARNGAEALAKVRDDGFAAIVLDLMMPVMSGWEFLDACSAELLAEHIPVAVATASYAPAAVASRPAVSVVLSKPFDLDVLEAIVAQLIARQQPGEGGHRAPLGIASQEVIGGEAVRREVAGAMAALAQRPRGERPLAMAS